MLSKEGPAEEAVGHPYWEPAAAEVTEKMRFRGCPGSATSWPICSTLPPRVGNPDSLNLLFSWDLPLAGTSTPTILLASDAASVQGDGIERQLGV